MKAFSIENCWTLVCATPIVSNLESIAKKHGMSVAIGGSIAYNLVSSNDLDLIIFNLKTSIKSDHESFIKESCEKLGFEICGAVDHSNLGDEKLVYKLKTVEGKRIDLLFPNLLFSDRIKDTKVLKRTTDYKK